MKYIVSALNKYVLNQKPQESNKTIIRIDGFEDVRIYDLFCRGMKKYCEQMGIRLIAKLSYPKFTELKNVHHTDFVPAITSMQQNEWIDMDDSLTQYRNILPSANEKLLVILMGTEVIEDKGGIHDIYFINSTRMETDMYGSYSDVFSMCQWEADDKYCIDKLFKWLFELVPINLYKLSCLADDWSDIDNISMFIEYFYKNLPAWNLCKREEGLPNARTILKSHKNLLLTNYDFIERNTFKKISRTQFEKYNKKIAEYNNNDLPYSEQYAGWIDQSIKTYDEYASILSDFILGRNINELRSLLIGVDFAITEAVLGLKLHKEPNEPRSKTIKVYGNPLNAMLKTIHSAILSTTEASSVTQIEFNFTRAKLVNQIDTSGNTTVEEQLEDTFKNICYNAGGVIEYIAKRNWYLGDNDIEIISTPNNFLTPNNAKEQVENSRVSSLGVSQILNKIEFTLILKDSSSTILDEVEYEWCFSNDEPWMYSFADICYKYHQLNEEFVTSFLPFGINKDLKRFMYLKSEQEFFDTYEETEINYIDLLDIASEYHFEAALTWKAEFSKLGAEFINFCKALTTKGFYASLDEINVFTDTYIKLGNNVLENSFTENLKWVLNLYIHAFAIEQNNFSVTRDEAIDFCIIPSWHPVILQKLVHQSVFILDGCEQWWSKSISNADDLSKVSQKAAVSNLQELIQLSCIHQAVDIFPTAGRHYFGNLHTFGNFCLCGNANAQENIRIKDMLRKEAVFDDDFSEGELTHVDADALMIFDVIEDYINAFPNKAYELGLAFIDPSELQPVVAAIHKYIDKIKKQSNGSDIPIKLTLNILVKPENRGGRNYLSYWVNTFFSQDENTDIKIFLNEWTSKEDIKKLLPVNTDIVFMMDLLKVDNFGFVPNTDDMTLCPSDCKYPIVFKPTPSSQTSIKRRIELTQSQFEASTVHSQVVYYNNHLSEQPRKKVVVVKEVCIDGERRDLIDLLHQKAYWVICIDGGMDGALLKNDAQRQNIYSIIGFSTGKGHHGQYNLTITARDSIVTQVKRRFEHRVRNLFKWSDERARAAAEICVKEASKLDGVSLLSAINQNTYNINEFMAYILTSVQMQKQSSTEALNIVFYLDSYRHWFAKDVYNTARENKSRPDFLNVSAKIGDDGKLHLIATVIECKIAKFANSTEHITKAITQVEHGLSVLTELFKPTPNDSIRRRYWYAQLYRALTFSQITFHDNTEEYLKLAAGLKSILDGDFVIEWNGKVMGYWVDMQGNNTISNTINVSSSIEILSIPQSIIQKLILGDDSVAVEYVDIIPEIIEDSTIIEDEPEMEDIVVVPDVVLTPTPDGLSETVVVPPLEVPPVSTNENTVDDTIPVDGEPDQEDLITETETSNNEPYSTITGLSNVKAYIGKDNRGNVVNWSFGHAKLSNRHLLITGSSGQGKTYLMQTMLSELSAQGISSMVFDYTEGFRLDQLEPEFVNRLQNKIVQKIVYFDGVPVNPFRRQEIEVLGMKAPEKISDVATRIADIFTNVYKFGEQQFSAIYAACKNGLEKFGENMNMQIFRKELDNINTSFSKSVLSKLTPFFDSVTFNCDNEFDWNNVTNSDGTLTIFQLTNFVRELQVVITELMLWDAWHYYKKYGNKENPFVVVLDEAQNLSHKSNSPSAKILTEGRKFGWSAWFATQFLKPQLDDAEINRLQQAAFRVYFKPADNDLTVTSKQLGNTSNWTDLLRGLQKGQCIVAGERDKLNGDFGPTNPTVTKIASFKERNGNYE